MTIYEKIRKRYPKPRISGFGLAKGHYCVGGAACSFAGIKGVPFPRVAILADAICMLNPRTNYAEASRRAGIIITHNDRGHFGRAWRQLKLALAQKIAPKARRK